MSNSIETGAFFNAIEAACRAGWTVTKTYFGMPRQEVGKPNLPYAVVTCPSVEQSIVKQGTSGSVRQDYTFKILGRFAWPTSPSQVIEIMKSVQANAILPYLQPGSRFATYGLLPLCSHFDFSEPDSPVEGAYELTITFTVSAFADHSTVSLDARPG